jgi:hypothetical protein
MCYNQVGIGEKNFTKNIEFRIIFGLLELRHTIVFT